RRGLKGLPQRVMFTISLLTFLVASLDLAAQIAAPSILVRFGLINNIDVPLEQRPEIVNRKMYNFNLIILWTTELLPLISDAIVIWRAWVICAEQLWLMVLPISMWIGTAACSFAYLDLTTSPAGVRATGGGSLTVLTIANLLSASIALSIATNAVSTLVIGYKLFTHHKVVAGNLGRAKQSQALNVLILLVESGVLYCCLQTVTLILTLAPNPYAGPGSAQYITGQIFFACYTEISTIDVQNLQAMYPTIIIVLVNIQRSFVDNYGIATIADMHDHDHHHEMRPATFGHLSFAVDEVQSPTRSISIKDRAGSNGIYSMQCGSFEEKKQVAQTFEA
ncbi:hypothetical protein H0H87_009994, partial [Tephrocybe sp. NHM501043]